VCATAAGPARVFSWTGALLFAVSLTYFVFAYLWGFGASADGGRAAPAVTWNVALFTLFALHHSIFAREPVRGWVRRVVAPDLERSVYVWLASLLFLAVCLGWRPVPGTAWSLDGAPVWLVRAVGIAALWLMLRSVAVLDVWTLAGLRLQAQGPSDFKTTGPYGWVRHPIYAGWCLFVFAATPMTMTRLLFAVVSCAYLLVAIPLEERTMRAASPGAYGRYMAQVPWRLVPGVY